MIFPADQYVTGKDSRVPGADAALSGAGPVPFAAVADGCSASPKNHTGAQILASAARREDDRLQTANGSPIPFPAAAADRPTVAGKTLFVLGERRLAKIGLSEPGKGAVASVRSAWPAPPHATERFPSVLRQNAPGLPFLRLLRPRPGGLSGIRRAGTDRISSGGRPAGRRGLRRHRVPGRTLPSVRVPLRRKRTPAPLPSGIGGGAGHGESGDPGKRRRGGGGGIRRPGNLFGPAGSVRHSAGAAGIALGVVPRRKCRDGGGGRNGVPNPDGLIRISSVSGFRTMPSTLDFRVEHLGKWPQGASHARQPISR